MSRASDGEDSGAPSSTRWAAYSRKARSDRGRLASWAPAPTTTIAITVSFTALVLLVSAHSGPRAIFRASPAAVQVLVLDRDF